MNGYTFLLLSILRLFLLIAALVLLAKAKLLPLYLYLTIAEFIGPALKVDHRLLPAAYWISRYRQHRQEENAALGALLATAKPLYGPGGYYSRLTASAREEQETEE